MAHKPKDTYKYREIKTDSPEEWLHKIEEDGELVYCKKRAARMHTRFCDILRKAIPIAPESGYIDKGLKSVNICNDCEVTRNKLSVRRFIEYQSKTKNKKKDSGDNI